MIPFRMLNGSPSKGLHMSGLFPDVTNGHQELNYNRLQAHRRVEELNGAMRRNDLDRLRLHFATHRPMLVHRRPMPQIPA
jgi:hypothetical protein